MQALDDGAGIFEVTHAEGADQVLVEDPCLEDDILLVADRLDVPVIVLGCGAWRRFVVLPARPLLLVIILLLPPVLIVFPLR